jgi:hypothetical protein
MTEDELKKSAEFIVRRNASNRVLSALVTFEPCEGRLKIVYCFYAEPEENDREDCELACTELIAEFPEVKVAETMCVPIAKCPISIGCIGGVVFTRKQL